jgi:hypothetical protein
MAQPPFRSDAFQVENRQAPAGPRLIQADEEDGSLRFLDSRVPLGINLHQLAGLQQMHNTIVVSKTGLGASKNSNGDPITTIQAGLDAVPAGSDVNNPWTVFVAPGFYVEDIYIVKDGITLQGLGGCRVQNASAVSTFRIRAGVGDTPRRVKLSNLRIENVTLGEACVDINSARFASGTLTIASVPNIGDILTVAGTPLTAIAHGGAPAPGEFELGTTVAETATNLVTAINDPVNGLVGTVISGSVGPVVTIRALSDGVSGNMITLSSSVPLVLMVSGPTLTGGADASSGSSVGLNLIEIVDCDLIPTLATGFTVRAAAVNNIRVSGGNWADSATGTRLVVTDCAHCSIEQVAAKGVALTYDNTNPNLPSLLTSKYEVVNSRVGAGGLETGFVGVGSIEVTQSTILGPTVYSADSPARSFVARNSSFGGLTVGGVSPQTVLSNCTRGSLVGSGTGTLSETQLLDSQDFVASSNETYLFPEPQPDLEYTVIVEPSGPYATINDFPFIPVGSKTVTGFDISFGAPQTLSVRFSVLRDI